MSTLLRIAEMKETDRIKASAIRILAHSPSGTLTASKTRMAELTGTSSWRLARRHLARMRAVGLLDYRVGGQTVTVWWLEDGSATTPPAPSPSWMGDTAGGPAHSPSWAGGTGGSAPWEV